MMLISRILVFFSFLSVCFSFIQHPRISRVVAANALEGLSASTTALPPKVAVILVDHGSRKSEANNMLIEVASKYKALYNIEIVEAAHMELAEPSISTAFKKCVDQGAKRIICHPFFLSRGRHVQEDIPEMMRMAAAEHSGVHELEYSITEPLGVQDQILELIHLSITTRADKDLLP